MHREGPRAGQWKKGQLLAKGAHGAVYMGLDERTGGLIAVKEIGFTPKDRSMVLQLQAEVDLLAGCQHPHIIRYLGTEVDRVDEQDGESLLYIFRCVAARRTAALAGPSASCRHAQPVCNAEDICNVSVVSAVACAALFRLQ